MFASKILYPGYTGNGSIIINDSLKNYLSEAKVLIDYMKDVYKIINYQLDNNGIIIFPLKERWLRGEEYGFMLRHYKTYEALGHYKVHYK